MSFQAAVACIVKIAKLGKVKCNSVLCSYILDK